MTDLDREVGFLTGKQDAMQRELKEIKADVKDITSRLGEQDKTMSRVEGKIDGLIAAQKSTDKHPITVTTQIETSDGKSSSVQASIVKRVLRWPSLPWVICILAILLIAIVCIAALTGRDINTFIPTGKA